MYSSVFFLSSTTCYIWQEFSVCSNWKHVIHSQAPVLPVLSQDQCVSGFATTQDSFFAPRSIVMLLIRHILKRERNIQIISCTKKNFSKHERQNVMNQGQSPLQNRFKHNCTNVLSISSDYSKATFLELHPDVELWKIQ